MCGIGSGMGTEVFRKGCMPTRGMGEIRGHFSEFLCPCTEPRLPAMRDCLGHIMWFTEAGELLGPDDRMCQGWGCNGFHVYLGNKGLLCLCPDSVPSHPLAPRLLSSPSDHSVMLTFLINVLSRFSDPQQQNYLLGLPCSSMP